jgi:hypothetical protein
MSNVWDFLLNHWGTVLLVVAYIGLALINNLPKPGSNIGGYEYFYNVVQTLLNNPVVQRFEQAHPSAAPHPLDLNPPPK